MYEVLSRVVAEAPEGLGFGGNGGGGKHEAMMEEVERVKEEAVKKEGELNEAVRELSSSLASERGARGELGESLAQANAAAAESRDLAKKNEEVS